MKMPVVAYDSVSGESAVLMDIEEYEKLAEFKKEMEHECEECGDFEEIEDELLAPERQNEEDSVPLPREEGFHHTMNFEESEPASIDFPSFSSEPEWLHSSPPLEWEKKAPTEETSYPGFAPVEEEESDEEPIFFEEPV